MGVVYNSDCKSHFIISNGMLPRPPPMVWVGGIRRRGGRPPLFSWNWWYVHICGAISTDSHVSFPFLPCTLLLIRGCPCSSFPSFEIIFSSAIFVGARDPRKSTASETSRALHHSSTSTGGGGEALETQESQQHQKQAEPHTTAPHPQGGGSSTRNPRKSTASETSREKH